MVADALTKGAAETEHIILTETIGASARNKKPHILDGNDERECRVYLSGLTVYPCKGRDKGAPSKICHAPCALRTVQLISNLFRWHNRQPAVAPLVSTTRRQPRASSPRLQLDPARCNCMRRVRRILRRSLDEYCHKYNYRNCRSFISSPFHFIFYFPDI